MCTLPVFARRVADFLFPRVCVVCKQRLQVGEEYICVSCLQSMPYTRLEGRRGNVLERLFMSEDYELGRATALYYYQTHSSRTQPILSFKYRHRTDVALWLGRVMARQLAGSGFFEGVDVIVPVPLSSRRLFQRGYNQCELLAKGISGVTHIPVNTAAVVRKVDNATQTHLDYLQREANVSGIFELRRSRQLHGKHVLLVDDVITTGSTLRQLAKVVAAAGDVTVSVLAVALSTFHKHRPEIDTEEAT